MSPEQRRKFNTAVGGLFIASGLLAWGLAVYFAVTPNPPKPAPSATASQVDLGSCRSALGVLGYQAVLKAEEIEVFEPLGPDPKAQLERSSVATTMCKLQLKAFCMGDGCEKPGLSFTLMRPVKRDVAAPARPSAAAGAGGAKPAAPKAPGEAKPKPGA